jgi:hypothetical protein
LTPEQFVFWLDGYLSGMVHDESVKPLYETLDTQLKEIIRSPYKESQVRIYDK